MITSKSKSVLKRGTSGIVAAALSLPIIAAASPFDASAAKEKYKYGLFINNVQVEGNNADDILGNGVFSYNASSKTLTIDGDYEFGSLGGVGAIRNTGIEGLTVYTASDSYLSSVDDCFVVDKTTIFTGPGTLNITAGNCDGTTSSKTGIYAQLIEGTVSFKNATVNINADAGYWGDYDSSKGTCTVVFIRDSDININATNKAFAAAKNINLINSYIASPATYYLDTVNSNTIKEKTDDGYTDAKNVSIRSDGNFYGMKIAGVPVTNANKGDILGDGVFEYLPESKTLLVNGNIETDYTVIDVDNTVASNYDIYPLTIDVQKNSTLTGNKHGGIHLSNGETTITGGGSLSIKAPTATGIGLLDDATLNISGADIDIDAEYGITGNAEFVGGTEESLILTDSDIHIKVPDGNPAISQMRGQGIVNHGYSFSGMNLGVQTEKWGSEWTEYFGKMDGSYASEITLTRQDCQIEKYDLYIDGVQVNQYNADDILGNGVFSYDREKQELWIEGGFKSKSRDNDLIKSKLDHSLSIYATRNVKLENDNQTYTLNSYNNGPVYITEYATNNGITMCTLSIGGELTIEDTTLNVLGDSYGYGIDGNSNYNCIIKNANVNVYDNSTDDTSHAAISNFKDLILENGSYIASPTDASYSTERKKLVDSNGSIINEVQIRVDKGYPVITKQPENAKAMFGNEATFTVEAKPADESITNPGFKYQWQWFDTSADEWKDSGLSSAKTATFKVTSTPSREGMKYRCVITSKNGNKVISDTAILLGQSGIKTQPKDVTGAIGTDAKFTVAAAGRGTLTYQWQYYSSSEQSWKDSGMTGAKTATLTVPITEARDGQKYRCVIKDSYNGISDNFTSSMATLTVATGFTKQPASVTQAAGTTAKFTATASGKGTISYQWQYYSKSAGEWKNSGLSSAKTSTLSVTVSETSDGQKYRCIATASDGTKAISNAATIKVATAITKQPANASGAVGSNVKFTVTASGAGSLSYQWQYYDKTSSTWKDSGMTGAKTATLTVPVTEARNGQKYRCIVKSSNGTSDTSSSATLTAAPTITKQPANVSGAIDSSVKFNVTASGTGTLSYQWQYYDKASSTWKDSGMTGAKTAALTVPVTAARDGQKYRCIVKANGSSVTSSAAKLTVKTAITKQPADVSGAINSNAKFTVTASGAGTLSYQWQYYDKASSTWKDSGMIGAKTTTLTVPVTAARDGQKYRCIVKSSNGTTVTSSAAKLTVKAAITKQPANASGTAGSNVKFSVTASGAGTLSYQWQYYDKSTSTWKDSGMTGAKTSTLTVPVTAARNGQKYRCIVKSSNGTSATSSTATLTVK
jgi:hypothetical protein